MAIGWGSLAVFLACMVALGLGSRDILVVLLAAAMSLVCFWAFNAHQSRTERTGTSSQARRAVSPYLERGER